MATTKHQGSPLTGTVNGTNSDDEYLGSINVQSTNAGAISNANVVDMLGTSDIKASVQARLSVVAPDATVT
jgi:hypothetical protein